jgi:hypothetical protein
LVILYPLVWTVVWQTGSIYRDALANGVEIVYRAVGLQFEFRVSESNIVYRYFERPVFEAHFSSEGVDTNLAFLATLLLITPGMLVGRRLLRMVAGVALLFASHVLFVVTKVENSLIAAEHPLAGSPAIWTSLDNFFEITGKAFVPVLIWLSLSLPFMLGAEESRVKSLKATESSKRTGRNDPCPCGSGKKFKRCCGR